MNDIAEKIKEIEEAVKANEHTEGQVGFYFVSAGIDMTLEDTAVLKKTLIDDKIIGSEDNVYLEKVGNPESDICEVCREYYINPELTESFENVIKKADGYYKICADGSYERSGYLWSDCRLIRKESDFVLLEFYICD